MNFILEHLDLLILIVVGVFIALNPSPFVRGFDKRALQTQKWVRLLGIAMIVIFSAILVYGLLKK